MRLEDKFRFMDYDVKETIALVHSEKTKESLEKFSNTCKRILETNDPLCAYIFATQVSHQLDEDYYKLFNVRKFEDLVLQSFDEDMIYGFGKDVKGANLERIYSRLNSSSARKDIEKDMQTL